MRKFHAVTVIGIVLLMFSGWGMAVSSKSGTNEKETAISLIEHTLKDKEKPSIYDGKQRKIVYLTMDDGPSKYTDALLKVLDTYDIPATHFLIGSNIRKYPAAVKKYHDRGDYIGMHSMTHNYSRLYTKGKIVEEMMETQALIAESIGKKPNLFRCPFGSVPGLKEQLRDQAAAAGLKTWDWTIDSYDWSLQKKPDKILNAVKAQLKNPVEVILLHEKEATIKILPSIIEAIQANGYDFAVYEEEKHFMMNFMNDKRL